MRLRSLAVNQFRKFTQPMRLDGMGEGLNVVVGPNEMGKSTLLLALRAALFEKHGSRAQPIVALQNDRSQAAPVVELAFELDDGLYRIAKRFIKKPYARLSCPDGRRLEGEAAEDRLRALLGFEEPGKTGAKPEALGMWNVLWVRQGQSFGALELPASARASLHGALETEVGAVLGGRRGRALPQAIERQLGELQTATGRPRGAYRELNERVEGLGRELAELRERRQELAKTLEQLEEAQQALDRLASGERDRADQEALEEARQRHRQLSELEARILAAATGLELGRRNLEQAERAQAERRALREAVALAEGELAAARERRDAVREQERDARARRDGLLAEVRAAEAAVAAAEQSAARERRLLAVVARRATLDELGERCARAQAAEQRRSAAQQAAAALPVTEEALQAIRRAAKELESLDSRLGAAATRIRFEMTAEALAGIAVEGEAVTAERPEIRAIEPVAIILAGGGRILVEPAIKDRDKLLGQQRVGRDRLRAALEAVAAASPAEAEEQHGRRQRLLQEAELARQEAELHAPASKEHAAGAQALADHLAGLRRLLARESEALGLSALPDRETAERALREGEARLAAAQARRERARAALAGPEESFARLQAELGGAEGRCKDAEPRLDKQRRQLQAAEAAQPDAALQAAIEAAAEALSARQVALGALEAGRGDETLPQLDARITRLDRALRERRDKRERLQVEISRLSSRVEAAEGGGLDEAIARKARELALAEEEQRRCAREAQVLSLLLTSLRAAEQEAKERYLSPVLGRLRPYLQVLFPGAEIRLDEDLGITGVVREAGYEEAFHHLSLGTQEQIAVLVRLAFAEMLVEQGQPATVILDDALVFSDDRRMGRMFDILTLAARKVQIVVFTCREQLFEQLGGTPLVLQPAGPEELASA